MGNIADLDQEVAYGLDVIDFGSDMDALLAELIDMKTIYNAHVHTAINTVPSSSISANNAVGFSDHSQFGRTEFNLTGLGQRFIGTYSDVVTFVNNVKSVFNIHEHGAADAVPDTSISLSVPNSITDYEEEQWNRAYYPFKETLMGTKMRAIVAMCHDAMTVYNIHEHPTAMSNVTVATISATNPVTLS